MQDRFEAWYSTALMVRHTFNNLGVSEGQYKIVFVDLDIEMYIAASLDTKEKVKIWQTELDKMKSDGLYDQILKKYGF